MKSERIFIFLIIGIFVLSIVSSLNELGSSATKEEAVEISKHSTLVQKGLANSPKFVVETTYYNSSMVEKLKEGHRKMEFESIPEGHDAWEVVWWFFYRAKPGSYDVIVIIDAETGTLAFDTRGIEFL